MRVTQNMLNNNMLRNLNRNLREMEKLQDTLASGKRINRPSDDPVGIVHSMRFRTELVEINKYKGNVENALSWMETTDTALDQLGSALQRVRELTVQGSTGTMNQDSRIAIADEIDQLKDHIGQVANTSIQGRHIFSGTKTTEQAYDHAAGQWKTDVVNDDFLNYEIGQGVTLPINVDGGIIFNGDKSQAYEIKAGENEFTFSVANALTGDDEEFTATIEAGEYNIVQLTREIENSINREINASNEEGIKDIEIAVSHRHGKITFSTNSSDHVMSINREDNQALAGGIGDVIGLTQDKENISNKPVSMDEEPPADYDDYRVKPVFELLDKISAALRSGEMDSSFIADLEANIDNVLANRADLGARINRLEMNRNRLDDFNISFSGLLSKVEDADIAETITKLTSYENVYRASLSTGARILQPSLIDFLR